MPTACQSSRRLIKRGPHTVGTNEHKSRKACRGKLQARARKPTFTLDLAHSLPNASSREAQARQGFVFGDHRHVSAPERRASRTAGEGRGGGITHTLYARPDDDETILSPHRNVGATSLPWLLLEPPVGVLREAEASSVEGTVCLEALGEAALRCSPFVLALRSEIGDGGDSVVTFSVI